jgi:L-lactate dehydrogenase complex protein LldG
MKEITQKEKVLKNLRDGLLHAMPAPFDDVDFDAPVFFLPPAESLDIAFAEAFTKASGKFIYCSNTTELSSALLTLLTERGIKHLFCGEDFFDGLLEDYGITCYYTTGEAELCDASLTTCEVLISRLGTVVLSSKQGSGRRGFIVPPVHIVVASSRQLVMDIKDAFEFLNKRYGSTLPSMISFITGPSRTADIEKTLVYGAHGPKEIFLFLLDDQAEVG